MKTMHKLLLAKNPNFNRRCTPSEDCTPCGLFAPPIRISVFGLALCRLVPRVGIIWGKTRQNCFVVCDLVIHILCGSLGFLNQLVSFLPNAPQPFRHSILR